ncbi:MAG TPA: DUF2007 domain-containing protein [Planctomycetota bacterium]|nr:DUF2007 domain-containing protein [Planctomycetota bacterium]
MKTVYTTSTLADAELFRVRLRNYGIQSEIDGDNSPLRGPATPFNIIVSDEDFAEAEKILKEAFPAPRASRRPRKAAPAKKKAPAVWKKAKAKAKSRRR